MSDQAPARHASVPPPTDSDYDSILAAVMETARGRWFLNEYARRNRSAETGTLLAAIGRIEALLESRGDDAPDRAEQAAPLDAPAAAQLAATQAAMAATLDSLVECGAPSFLCDDLARHLKTLKALCAPGRPPDAPDGTQAMPTFEVGVETQVLEIGAETADTEAVAVRTELPAVIIEPVADAAPVLSPAPETIDAFADIRALSAAEKIALFS